MASRKRIDFISFEKRYFFETTAGYQYPIMVQGYFPDHSSRSDSGLAYVEDGYGNTGEMDIPNALHKDGILCWMENFMQIYRIQTRALLRVELQLEFQVYDKNIGHTVYAYFNSLPSVLSSSSFSICVRGLNVPICQGYIGINTCDTKEVEAFIRKYYSGFNFTDCLDTPSQPR